MNLTKEENSEINIDEESVLKGNKRGEFSIVGKLLFEHVVNKEIVQSTMAKII